MSGEENKALVRRYWEEVVNQQSLASIDKLVSPERAAALKSFAEKMYRTFPDCRITIDDMIAEGDEVAARWTAQTTHLGDYASHLFGDIPPTGKRITYTGTNIYRIRDGKIVEDQGNVDALGILEQLGAFQSLNQGGK